MCSPKKIDIYIIWYIIYINIYICVSLWIICGCCCYTIILFLSFNKMCTFIRHDLKLIKSWSTIDDQTQPSAHGITSFLTSTNLLSTRFTYINMKPCGYCLSHLVTNVVPSQARKAASQFHSPAAPKAAESVCPHHLWKLGIFPGTLNSGTPFP